MIMVHLFFDKRKENSMSKEDEVRQYAGRFFGMETEFGCVERVQRGDDTLYEYNKNQTGEFIRHSSFLDMSDRWLPWDPTARLREERTSERGDHDYFRDRTWLRYGNIFLKNGGRFYLDGFHLEYSTPLCRNAKEFVVCNRAGYLAIDTLRKYLQEEHGRTFLLFRNNVAQNIDHENCVRGEDLRVSYACHENYLMPRAISEKALMQNALPFFILRLPIIGAGKVGSDMRDSASVHFQISQRADFFVDTATRNTTSNRGWYNQRDVPYADTALFRRIHVICGDSNMLETPEYLKVGLTSILFSMIAHEQLGDRFELAQPIRTGWMISRDISCRQRIHFRGLKKTRTVIDCLKEYHDLFSRFIEQYYPNDAVSLDVLSRFFSVVEKLERGHLDDLVGVLDWVTKKYLMEDRMMRKGGSWDDAVIRTLDIQYHDNNHEDGLFYYYVPRKLKQEFHRLPDRIVKSDFAITHAVSIPPPTRSRWIRKIYERYRRFIASSDYWYRISFSLDGVNLTVLCIEPPAPWDAKRARHLFAFSLEKFLFEIQRDPVLSPWVRVVVPSCSQSACDCGDIDWYARSLGELCYQDGKEVEP